MADLITQYDNDRDGVTNRFSESLVNYFSHPFADEQSQGLMGNVLVDMWSLAAGDSFVESELQDLHVGSAPNGETIYRGRGGGRYFYVYLSSSEEVEVVRNKMQRFQNEFPEFEKFRLQIANLIQQYEQVDQARSRVLQLLADSEAQVIFSERCGLLGKTPVEAVK